MSIFCPEGNPLQRYFPFCFLSPLLPLNTPLPWSKAVAVGWVCFGIVPEHPPLKAPLFAHHPRGKKLHENNAKTGIFCNILKDNLIFAHSVTRATPTKAIINGSFDFVAPESCFEFQPFFFSPPSQSAVCMLSYIFIFQRALNLSTKIKLNKHKKDGVWRLLIFFFAGNILYYTDFILIIINLCLYWRCV